MLNFHFSNIYEQESCRVLNRGCSSRQTRSLSLLFHPIHPHWHKRTNISLLCLQSMLESKTICKRATFIFVGKFSLLLCAPGPWTRPLNWRQVIGLSSRYSRSPSRRFPHPVFLASGLDFDFQILHCCIYFARNKSFQYNQIVSSIMERNGTRKLSRTHPLRMQWTCSGQCINQRDDDLAET